MPENPFRLINVTLKPAEVPDWTVRGEGEDEMEKSGFASTVAEIVMEWSVKFPLL